MKRTTSKQLAAVALAAMLVAPSAAAADDQSQQQQRQQQPRAGLTTEPVTVKESSKEEIRSTLGSFVSAALSNDFNDVVENLVEPDRERIGRENIEKNIIPGDRTLDEQLDEKFGNNIDFDNDNLQTSVFNAEFSSLVEGQVLATIPASDGMDRIAVPMVNVGKIQESWKIDLPDSVTGAQLKTALSKHLQMVSQQIGTLPQDANKAGKRVAMHVLTALNDVGAARGTLAQEPQAER